MKKVLFSIAFFAAPLLQSYVHYPLLKYKRITHGARFHASEGEFDANEFESALKSMGPVWTNKLTSTADSSVYNAIRENQKAKAEEIFRKYPFDYTELPLLPDCNNYYSGKFGDFFWHQNADQVYVYIPIDDATIKNDIKVDFEAKQVTMQINGENVISFQCLERIIPDGSFWVIETDKDGKRYVQLDLEKRYRMINWKGLFGEPNEEDVQKLESKTQLLDKMFAANKGEKTIISNDLTPQCPHALNRYVQAHRRAPRIDGRDDEQRRLGENDLI